MRINASVCKEKMCVLHCITVKILQRQVCSILSTFMKRILMENRYVLKLVILNYLNFIVNP